MATVTATRWKVDTSHTVVEFAIRHMMFATVKGRFRQFEGVITGDASELVHIEGTVQAASIDTGDEQRDAHLRSADFFDVDRFPTLTFRSRTIKRLGEGEFEVVGDLTIHGVTREVPFRVRIEGHGKDPWGNERLALSAEARINREDFGLTWNALLETGGVLVGKDVQINLHVEAVKES